MMDYRGHFGTTVVNNKVIIHRFPTCWPRSCCYCCCGCCQDLGVISTLFCSVRMHWSCACALECGFPPVSTDICLVRPPGQIRWLLKCTEVGRCLQIWVTGGWDPYTKSRMQREKTQAKALLSTEIYQPLQVMRCFSRNAPLSSQNRHVNTFLTVWGFGTGTFTHFSSSRFSGPARFLMMVWCALQDTWKTGPDMPERRAFHQAVSIGGSIYVLGGFDGVRDLDSVCKLDTATGAFQPLHL